MSAIPKIAAVTHFHKRNGIKTIPLFLPANGGRFLVATSKIILLTIRASQCLEIHRITLHMLANMQINSGEQKMIHADKFYLHHTTYKTVFSI